MALFLVLFLMMTAKLAAAQLFDTPAAPPPGGCPACPVCPVLETAKCSSYTDFSLQLRWLKSAQFAGFYAAQAMGFWEDECLNVVLYPPATYGCTSKCLWVNGADAAMPHYLSFLKYAVAEDEEVTHVSQHFRRGGRRVMTSPVFEIEKTIDAQTLKDLKQIKYGIDGWPSLDSEGPYWAAFRSQNVTLCAYADPFTKEVVPCDGTEDIAFQRKGPGIQQLLAKSESYSDPIHATGGMVYDQLGQLLATPLNGELLEEGVDFKVFDLVDVGVFTMEDGIVVNRTWLSDLKNQVTLVKFLKGMNKGWIYCRDNEDACVDLVTPEEQESYLKAHQRYQMREVMHGAASGVGSSGLLWTSPECVIAT